MPQHHDWSAIIAETFCQMGGKGIGPPAEFAIAEPSIAADMSNGTWGRQSPVIDLLKEIHSKTLINKWRSGKVAPTVHHD
jgi:hypothetical protein